MRVRELCASCGHYLKACICGQQICPECEGHCKGDGNHDEEVMTWRYER